jgi:hypothetical protein
MAKDTSTTPMSKSLNSTINHDTSSTMASSHTYHSSPTQAAQSTSFITTTYAPYTHKCCIIADPGITVLLPDYNTITSSHTTRLKIPSLQPKTCFANIFPTLTSGSLLSIGQLCYHGCQAIFNVQAVTITVEISLAFAPFALAHVISLDISDQATIIFCIKTFV